MSETTIDESELLEKEKEYVRQLKGKEQADNDLFGLAISGGGIRSASFALGVIQALNNNGLIKKLDYMSTVSGGGYIGSCLSWFLNKIYHSTDPEQNCSLVEKGKGARSSEQGDVLSYLRQHGKYLIPGDGLDIVSFMGVVLRSMFLGFIVYFPIIIACLFAMQEALFFEPVRNICPEFCPLWPLTYLTGLNPLLITSVFLVLCFAIIAILYSIGTVTFGGNSFGPYQLRTKFQVGLGRILKVFVLLLVIGTLPKVVSLMGEAAAIISGSISFLGILEAVYKLRGELNSTKEKGSGASEIVPIIASLLLIYGLLLAGYLAANSINPSQLLAFVMVSFVTGLLVNLNYVSLHRVYRDRLMEMFLPDHDAIKNGKWGLAKGANTKKLAKFKIDPTATGKKFDGPFHIINTNLIQIDAEKSKFRGRGGDNFILTPLYCGSNATKWCPTTQFNGGTMTLATAMAISGAAVNPHTGPSGSGATRNWLVSFLMSFFNFSLGYWAKNPRMNPDKIKFKRPNYFRPGFFKGLLGLGFNEDSKFIELSDGGHFENLAVYELIRRRVKTIIISDGGADLDFNFSDLANVVEKVRVDFGVEINFTDKDTPISDLLPDSAKSKSLYKEKYNLAKRGYATGVIKYQADKTTGTAAMEGKIYYIKTTMTGGLPEDIYGYKSGNPDFPDQSTADQFFDEAQFEAYRELGYQLTKKMLAENKILPKKS